MSTQTQHQPANIDDTLENFLNDIPDDPDDTHAPGSPVVEWEPQAQADRISDWRQNAVTPPDSILQLWLDYQRTQTESADSYIVGACLPVMAAALARRVWFPWGDDRTYPNLFGILAGNPGDRKSSAIKAAERLARIILPADAFLPKYFSPEAMFDAYLDRPDKILVVDEGNTILTDWQQASNGERVATRFLELYDCCPLAESFRRNRSQDNPEAARSVPETSTSVCLGATFNIAAFQGQAVRAGMARRFLYYAADGHGRLIVSPPATDGKPLASLAKKFSRLTEVEGPMFFSHAAEARWGNFQHDNRRRLRAADTSAESAVHRLNSEPMHVLKIAMIFQLARWALDTGRPAREIEADTLALAIEHVAECVRAADFIDSIATRARVREDAEIIIEAIRADFAERAERGSIVLTRSEITRRFAPNPGRRNALTPHDIYNRIIPELHRRGLAKCIQTAQRELYAFRAE